MEYRIPCCFCGTWIEDLGNDPSPLAEEGICCDKCYSEKVLPIVEKNTKFKSLIEPPYRRFKTGNKH